MGLLDDAIREHLDLKRQHGADATEVARQEREALSPPVRETHEATAAAPPADAPELAEPVAAREWAPEAVGHEPLAPGELGVEPPAGAFEGRLAEPGFAEPEASLGPAYAEPAVDDQPSRHPEPLEPGPDAPRPAADPADPGAQAPVEPFEPGPSEPPPFEPGRPEPPVAPGPSEPPPSPGPPTVDFDAEEVFAEEDARASGEPGEPLPPAEGEDVLEETPEFLQETPEHDRLWFEQKPPRDFDFDG